MVDFKPDFFSNYFCVFQISVYENENFFAAPPAGDMFVLHISQYDICDCFQYKITACVSIGIIKLFKIINIAHDKTVIIFGFIEDGVEFFFHTVPVPKPCQCVKVSQTVQFHIYREKLIFPSPNLRSVKRCKKHYHACHNKNIGGGQKKGKVFGIIGKKRFMGKSVCAHQKREYKIAHSQYGWQDDFFVRHRGSKCKIISNINQADIIE